MRAILLAATLLATPALGQSRGREPDKGQSNKVWTPAPTAGPVDGAVAPADRAGVASSADIGAPFSAIPSGAISGSGNTGPATVGTTPSTETVTPNVSR